MIKIIIKLILVAEQDPATDLRHAACYRNARLFLHNVLSPVLFLVPGLLPLIIAIALSMLRFNRQRPGHVLETRSGAFVFKGDPALFYECEFRARVKIGSVTKDEEIPGTAGKIAEGLQGDALEIAMDMEWDVLKGKDGIPTLIERIRTFVCRS